MNNPMSQNLAKSSNIAHSWKGCRHHHKNVLLSCCFDFGFGFYTINGAFLMASSKMNFLVVRLVHAHLFILSENLL